MFTRRTLLTGAAAAVGALAFRGAPALGSSGTIWDALRCRLQGDLVLPDDPDYAVAKQLYVQEYDSINPQAIAYCQSPADVSACLTFARRNGIPLVARSGGHSLGGYSTGTGLVIDLSRLNQVSVRGSVVTLGPGTQAVDLLNALDPYGIMLPSGLAPSVCAGGYLLGGGLGLLTRELGVACDRMLSARIVLANGEQVFCSERELPDLFWALRGGGGGNFGIVTSFTCRAVPTTPLTSFSLVYPYDAALEVWSGWQRWSLDAPRKIGSGPVVQLADLAPGAVPTVLISGAMTDVADALNPELDRLVAEIGRAPLARSVREQTYRDGMMGFWGCGNHTVDECHVAGHSPQGQLTRPVFGIDRSRLFSAPIPDDGLAAALAAFEANRRTGQIRLLRGQSLGGAANDLSRSATAYVHRDALFVTNYTLALVAPPSTADQDAARSWAAGGFAVLDPYSNHETYQNFIDPELPDWRSSYYAENYAPLVAIKHRYDPRNLFQFPQSIG